MAQVSQVTRVAKITKVEGNMVHVLFPAPLLNMVVPKAMLRQYGVKSFKVGQEFPC